MDPDSLASIGSSPRIPIHGPGSFYTRIPIHGPGSFYTGIFTQEQNIFTQEQNNLVVVSITLEGAEHGDLDRMITTSSCSCCIIGVLMRLRQH